jgi:hypothetical protein
VTDWSALFRSLTADTLDTVDTLDNVTRDVGRQSVQSVNTVQSVHVSKGKSEGGTASLSPLVAAFSILERRRPDHVGVIDWQHAVEDGRRFIVQWGEQADALGWTADDLFGLHDPPEQPDPRYRRLSRLDATGLIWLLHGRPVVAFTTKTAVIRTASGGTVKFYRRRPGAPDHEGEAAR